MQKLTEQQICRQAIDVQDACNISGVLNSYHEIVCNLRELKGTDCHLGDHPAVILFHDKLEDMLRIPMSERTSFFREAYEECNRKAERQCG